MPTAQWPRITRHLRFTAASLLVAGALGAGAFALTIALAAATSPPTPSLTSTPSSLSSSAAAMFAFADVGAQADPNDDHDIDAVTFLCSLDTAPFGSCTTPRSYSGVADGSTRSASRQHRRVCIRHRLHRSHGS